MHKIIIIIIVFFHLDYYFFHPFCCPLDSVARGGRWMLAFIFIKELSHGQNAYVKCIKTYFCLY
jgi:hypothetical protein